MMRSTLSTLLALLVAGSVSPLTALAYQTPEDVLIQQLNYYNATNYLPPNSRNVRTLQELNEQQRQAQHPSTTTNYWQQSSSTASSAQSSASVTQGTTDEEQTNLDSMSEEELLQLWQELNANTPTTNSTLQQQDKPLAPTGTATVAALGVLLLGAAVTLWRARRLQMK